MQNEKLDSLPSVFVHEIITQVFRLTRRRLRLKGTRRKVSFIETVDLSLLVIDSKAAAPGRATGAIRKALCPSNREVVCVQSLPSQAIYQIMRDAHRVTRAYPTKRLPAENSLNRFSTTNQMSRDAASMPRTSCISLVARYLHREFAKSLTDGNRPRRPHSAVYEEFVIWARRLTKEGWIKFEQM